MDLLFLAQGLDALGHQGGGDVEQLGAGLGQLGLRHIDVPFVGLLAKRVGHARSHPLRRVGRNAHVARDPVGGDKADSVDIARQAVRIGLDDCGRAVAVLFVDAHSQRRADAVALQEDHHLANLALLLPGRLDHQHPFGADPFDVVEALRLVFDDIEGLRAERKHDALGHFRPDPLDQPAAEVLLDAGGCGREDGGVALDLELPAILAVYGPLPLQSHVLARADAQHVSHYGYFKVGIVSRQLGDRVAGLFVVKRDALDDAFEGGHGRRRKVSECRSVKVSGVRCLSEFPSLNASPLDT